jgi:DNA-binding transcriptional LysR family regulator
MMKAPNHNGGLDFLLIIEAILEHKTITRAAEHLGMSQSALSHALVRLRGRFGDSLFVRAGSVMQPTPLAQVFAEPLKRSLAIIRNEILQATVFDPKTTRRTFKIAVSEIGALLLVPKILEVLRARAPDASLAPLQIPLGQLGADLENGNVDLAVGHMPELSDSFFQQRLMGRNYVAIINTRHPTIGARMTPREFQQTPIVCCTAAAAVNDIVKLHLAKQGVAQRVALETPHVMALAGIVGATEWMAFVPEELLATMSHLAPVRRVEVPMPAPRLDLKQHWHRRYGDDAAHRFLRSVVYDAVHE